MDEGGLVMKKKYLSRGRRKETERQQTHRRWGWTGVENAAAVKNADRVPNPRPTSKKNIIVLGKNEY